MSGRELDPDGTDSYHPEHPWEQVGHPLHVAPERRTRMNWPPEAAIAHGPAEAVYWRDLPIGGGTCTMLAVMFLPIDQMVMPLHDIDIDVIEGYAPGEQGPICTERLTDGRLMIHNGRHRVLRAILSCEYDVRGHIHERNQS